MLARSRYVRILPLIAGLCASPQIHAAELAIGDLKHPDRVVAAMQNQQLSAAQAKAIKLAIAQGSAAFSAKRYGAAYKAWGFAALTLPNSANLVMMAESELREIGAGTQEGNKAARRKAALPEILALYESARAAEKAKPMLGNVALVVEAHHACLKAYLATQIVTPGCGPLIWSGAAKN